MNKYGDAIRQRREECGLTQQQVADKMGKHVNTYSNLERGITRMNSDYAVKLNAILGMSIPEVFGYGIADEEGGIAQDVSGTVRLKERIAELEAEVAELKKEKEGLRKELKHLENENELLSQIKKFYEARVRDEKNC